MASGFSCHAQTIWKFRWLEMKTLSLKSQDVFEVTRDHCVRFCSQAVLNEQILTYSFLKISFCTTTMARQAAIHDRLWDGWAISCYRVCIVPQPATTSSEVLRSTNSPSRPVGMGVAVEDGTLCPQTNQSLSKHTKVLLLLQLETWLDGEEGMLLERSQLHFFSFRKFSWASFQP